MRTGLWVVTVVIAVPSALWFWEVPPVGDEGTVPGRMSRDPGTSGHICGSRRIACNQTSRPGVSPSIGHTGRTTSKEKRHEQQPHHDRRPAGRDRPDGRSDPGLRHAGGRLRPHDHRARARDRPGLPRRGRRPAGLREHLREPALRELPPGGARRPGRRQRPVEGVEATVPGRRPGPRHDHRRRRQGQDPRHRCARSARRRRCTRCTTTPAT